MFFSSPLTLSTFFFTFFKTLQSLRLGVRFRVRVSIWVSFRVSIWVSFRVSVRVGIRVGIRVTLFLPSLLLPTSSQQNRHCH